MNKIGLIAGGGNFPLLFAREAQKTGCEVFAAAIEGAASPELSQVAGKTEYFNLGQISSVIKFFKENGVDKIAVAGLVRHDSVFGGIRPDLRAAKMLSGLKDLRAQTIFAGLAQELSKDGIELVSSALFLGEFLPKAGVLTKTKPDKSQIENIRFGWRIAKALAGVDAGLTAAVCDKAVVALEAMEGTDECILRAGEILSRAPGKPEKTSGLVVVKVARENQDFRFDLPVVGKGTIESMLKAGARVLAIEAEKTLMLDKPEMLSLADAHQITITACSTTKLGKD